MADRAADYLDIPRDSITADWDRHGIGAGPIRNRAMILAHPDIALVMAFHDHIWTSKGTKDMVSVALRRGILVNLVSHEDEVFPLPEDYFKRLHNSLDTEGSRA